MTALAATDVTYTKIDGKIISGSGYRRNVFDIAFGNSTLTYPTGGVPLTKAKLGMPTVIKTFSLMEPDAGNGFAYKYDESTASVRIYQTAIHTHALHLNNADVADGAGARVNAGTNLLGSNTGADIAIAGVVNTAGAGGIVQAAAGTQTEATTSDAPAATTLRVVVEGY
jgi:hypothetical protein